MLSHTKLNHLPEDIAPIILSNLDTTSLVKMSLSRKNIQKNLEPLVYERAKHATAKFLTVETARKMSLVSLENFINYLLKNNHSKLEIYSALQEMFGDEMNRCMNPLFCVGAEKGDGDRLKSLENLLIKYFGLAGYINPSVFISLQYDGGAGQFKAMTALCLAKTMLEKFPQHESIQLVNKYFSSKANNAGLSESKENAVDSLKLFAIKENKVYFADQLLDEFLTEFSKQINYSGYNKLDKATPTQKLEMAFTEANKILLTLDLIKKDAKVEVQKENVVKTISTVSTPKEEKSSQSATPIAHHKNKSDKSKPKEQPWKKWVLIGTSAVCAGLGFFVVSKKLGNTNILGRISERPKL